MDPFIDVKKVFHLSCPDRSKIVARLKKRAIKDNRLDDANEEVIRHRLETYQRESKPLLDHYGDGLIVNIDATEPPIVVLNTIVSHIVGRTQDTSCGGNRLRPWRIRCASSRIFALPPFTAENAGAPCPCASVCCSFFPERRSIDYLCTGCAESLGQREVQQGASPQGKSSGLMSSRGSGGSCPRHACALSFLEPGTSEFPL